MQKKKLTLNKHTIRNISQTDLTQVAGGALPSACAKGCLTIVHGGTISKLPTRDRER